MDLEEHTLETAGERCEECGAKLTERELELALERSGPTLCSTHLAELDTAGGGDADEEPSAPAG
jgi:hypothetical protein